MTDRISSTQFHESQGVDDWRVIGDGAKLRRVTLLNLHTKREVHVGMRRGHIDADGFVVNSCAENRLFASCCEAQVDAPSPLLD